jgi:hypothetical protein
MFMKEEIKQGLKLLRPPNGDSTDKAVILWRWVVVVWIGVTSMALAFHIALACGVFPSIFAGFASATDYKQVRIELQTARIADIGARILDIRSKQCKATGDVRTLYLDSLQKMLVEYHSLTEKQYPLPDCADFVP